MVISGYVRPEQKHDKIFYVVLSLFAIAHYFALMNEYVLRQLTGYYSISIVSLSFSFLHFAFGRCSEEAGEPATYFKILMPPYYLSLALSYGIMPNNKALGTSIFDVGTLYFIVVTIWLIAFDKPIDKTKRKTTAADGSVTKHVIANDGYYFIYLIALYTSTGAGLAIFLSASAAGGPVAQTIVLQFFSVLILSAFLNFTQRATDKRRFAILMLMGYIQVDYFQTALLLTSDLRSLEFWKMIFIGELGSLVKNCGILGFLAHLVKSYIFRMESTNPYEDKEIMDTLQKKGLVDSMSEILSTIAIVIVFILEKEVRTWGGIDMWNVTVPAFLNNGTEGYFITEGCGLTCVGWTVNNGVPPPPVDELKSRWEIFFFVAVILVVRVFCLMLERVGLVLLASFLDKSSTVAPEEPADADLDEGGVAGRNTSEGRISLNKQTSEVANAATNVFEGVTLTFLFVSFLLAMGGCTVGLKDFMAFLPVEEGVEVTLVA